MPPDTGCDTTTTLRLTATDADRLALQFKALGHPIRLQIVDLLSRHAGEVCVCEIEAHFTLSQPSISHHLKVLREAGLVQAQQDGLRLMYHLRPEGIAALRGLLAEFGGGEQAGA